MGWTGRLPHTFVADASLFQAVTSAAVSDDTEILQHRAGVHGGDDATKVWGLSPPPIKM